MEYSKNSIYIVGCAKLPQKTQLLSPANTSFCRSSLTGIQAKFMMQISILSVILQRGLSKSLLVGRSIYTDYNAIIQDIGSRYLGHSQKALIFCIRNIIHTLQEQSMLPQHSG